MPKPISRFLEKINAQLFRSFLLLGLLTGIFLGSLSASASPWPSPTPSNGQKNFLLAVVEDAQENNSPLLALWFAATTLDNGEIYWMPIYPQPLNVSNATFADAHDPVRVIPQDLDFWQSLGLLREQSMWWDEIIVLDRFALASLTQLLQIENFDQAVSTWIEPQAALHQNVTLIQYVCAQSAQFNNRTTLDQLLLLTAEPAHLRTTLSSFELISLWDKLAARQFELSCKHPWAD